MSVSMNDIKELREKTGAGVMDVKKALDEADGDMKQAEEWLQKKGLQRAEKKADRETNEGQVYAYVHHDGKSGAMVKVLCETDFVAKNEEFVGLCKELAMQVTSMKPENVEEFLAQDYMRDPSKTIEQLIKETAATVGENVQLDSFERMEV